MRSRPTPPRWSTFYHGAEQLKSALDARYGENDARGRAQFHKLRHILLNDPDGVEKVIRALDYQRKKFPRRTRIGEVLRYFRRNHHRMRYAQTHDRHLPIGSGIVEAACKTVVWSYPDSVDTQGLSSVDE